eukprot:TRINITY_DN7068_c0_g3_i1.p1 TRINITY_DN7068_c0_g3~~TRINITY_DN7068_c0_g3_i1.p1  ORF type:complete len:1368 (+),score=413.56 TRINITY_DN7068_c0_g3_i1:90-4193(+)
MPVHHGKPRSLAGTPVWIPSSDNKVAAFCPATVVEEQQDGSTVSVLVDKSTKPDGGKTLQVSRGEIRLRFEREDGRTSDDNTSLVHMNDASILQNLELRHKQDKIYTYTASVLLAMNPYKWRDGLYEPEQCDQYRGKHIGAMPPHPFAIADTSYRLLVKEKKNQAMLISGESGAGKTETAKIVMKYLGHVSGTGSDFASSLQARVTVAQPILESIGNAATLRNNNSSRFGKYNKIFFDDDGMLADAGVTTYLLESSRVVVHAQRERNYHVFYEMLAGLSDEQLQEFGLDRKHPYRLLHSAGTPVEGFEEFDKRNYGRLRKAMATIGLEEEQIEANFKMLAGLIHLGDAAGDQDVGGTTSSSEDRTVELNEEAVAKAARLLGMDADELAGTLTKKRIKIPGRRSLHEVARTASQFRHSLHSLIKAIYKRLFEDIVHRINKSFKELGASREDNGGALSEDGERRHIGILDIYGFERLQRNSFEQLCINLANERLQQCFVENVLLAEQDVYRREGLAWTDLPVPDSTPVVRCIGQVFTTLDDFSSRLAKGMEKDATDERFNEKITSEAAKDAERKEILKKPKMSARTRSGGSDGPGLNESFTVRHYAGIVDYTTQGWLDKNNDRLLTECEDLIASSSNTALRALADEDAADSKRVSFRSISKKYQQDLQGLITTLETCNLHYIRCFKPNEEQKPRLFKQQLVLDQIIQCGTIELVKIMHDGYPNRCAFAEITGRFKSLLPEKFQRYGDRTFIEALMMAYKVPSSDWALGMSRLFLKAGQLQKLEDMRSEGAVPDADVLAGIVRSIVRKRWVRAFHAINLCRYIPRRLSQMYAERAASSLAAASLLTGRLALRLQAAQQRIARRRQMARLRLRKAFVAVRISCAFWLKARHARRQRVEQVLYRAAFLVARSRTWVARGRARAIEAEEQREAAARRRLEEERARLEAQRLQLEQQKAEEDERRKREEEERQRELARQREEEGRRREQEREELEARRAEEEARKEREEIERQAEALEASRRKDEEMAAERERLEKERREFEEEKRAWQARMSAEPSNTSSEGEKKKKEVCEASGRGAILAAATPARNSLARRASLEPGHQDAAAEDAADDITPMDSVSVVAPQSSSESSRKKEDQESANMQKKIDAVREEYDRRFEQLQRQMQQMAGQNQRLERMVVGETPAKAAQPPSQFSTPGAPAGSTAHLASPMQTSWNWNGDTSAGRQHHETPPSAAAQTLPVMLSPDVGHVPMDLEAVAKRAAEVNTQRTWWSHQRLTLMEELYPISSPFRGGFPAGPSSALRSSPVLGQISGLSIGESFRVAADMGASGRGVGMTPPSVHGQPEVEISPDDRQFADRPAEMSPAPRNLSAMLASAD